ncbi:putative ARM-like repeat-containing protein like [Verticillium longisporum]|uniref:Putative ARM-like repeat-containing protein like n=1 Tax=Verticillium longisporum TaxID=100787 RepID=A0A8I3APR2_VERLO|nr:putative ARM-like repeat-containing protein like [Verticillium longisporum]
MGKTRRNRVRPNRKDPLSTTPKPPSDPELAALREKSVLPVIKDLQSAEPKRRTAAAAAVANLVADTRCRKLFLREQIVHIILSETLTDTSLESRAAGWDILRLLAEEEEADFCVHLFRSDVLSAVEFAAKFVVETIKSKGAKTGKAEQKVLWSLIESLLALLTALSEAQDDILEAIVALPATVTLLFLALASADAPAPVRLDALSCLLILTEDNRRLAELVVADEDPKPFSALLGLQGAHGAGRVLACGVLHNVFAALKWYDGQPAGNKDLSDASLVRTLSSALQQGAEADETLPASSQWSKPAEVLQLALEILASIGTSLQESMANSQGKAEEEANGDEAMEEDGEKAEAKDDDEDMDDSKMEGDDEGEEEEEEEDDDDDIGDIQADMEMVTGVDNDDEVASDDLTTLSELVHKAVPEIMRLANSSTSPSDASLQAPALSALNNIAWSVACFDFTKDDNASILRTWAPAGKAIWENTISAVLAANTADVELASQVTSLAWAVARTLSGGRIPFQGEEHKKFMALYQASKTLDSKVGGADDKTNGRDEEQDPFQGLGVKCIGVLGQLALDPTPVALNREIGVFLITVVASLPDTPAADVVEALNQLFDIYGDEDAMCDVEVFWKDNFLAQLEGVQHKVKTMVKAINKRTNSELRTRADEVVLNLARFISYKKKNKPKA